MRHIKKAIRGAINRVEDRYETLHHQVSAGAWRGAAGKSDDDRSGVYGPIVEETWAVIQGVWDQEGA
jgi:hypothetical protein